MVAKTDDKPPKPSTLDQILSRLDRPDVVEKREELAKFLGLDSNLMEATLLHLAADLLPLASKTAAKLRSRANYDLCKFAAKEGAKIGSERAKTTRLTPEIARRTPEASMWTARDPSINEYFKKLRKEER